MRELLQEILSSVSRNKLRTFLTGFSVAWGIFMLIILLGSGNGLRNGMMSNFGDMAQNSINMGGSNTSIPYKGFQQGRRIVLNEKDMHILKSEFPEQIGRVAALAYHWNSQIAFGREYCTANLFGSSPDYGIIEGIKIKSGRFINETDIRDNRKVVVLDQLSTKTLFKDTDPVGQMVQIDGMGYVVVGVYSSEDYWNASNVYVPISTLFAIYLGGRRDVAELVFTVNGIETVEQSEAFEQQVRRRMAAEHTFSPDDRNALWMWNRLENYKQAMLIFNGIAMFIWIIGLGTLTAGIVGVSNIMLVTVRERTAEFGIRKALGARPSSLVWLVLVESVIITGTFGYIGMIGGVGVMEVVNYFIEKEAAVATGDSFAIFKNPTLELSVTFSATIVLIIAGMIAGYVPARRAARIKTIDAMRHNK